MALLKFNAAEVPVQDSFDPIPNSWYNVTIDDSEMKPTKDGKGAYLELRLSVVDGDYANRKVFTRLNLENANQVAQEIAYKQLSTICHAIGVIQVEDSSELHGKPFQAKVVVKPPQGDYDASNEVKGYKAVDGGGTASTASSSSTASAKPGWAGKKEAEPEPEAKKKVEPQEPVLEEETAAADTTIEADDAKVDDAEDTRPAWMKNMKK